ncbi:MAG: hypothetical protein ACYTGC_01180 [Planctomycetota bacterium]|jgi:hypothetical protein
MRTPALSILSLLLVPCPTLLAEHGDEQTPAARQFDFWVGEWDIVNKRLEPDGSWAEMGDAACKVYPILDGRAIVEHWRGTAWDRKTIGFSVRAYDADREKWFLLLSWPGRDRPGFGTLEGVFSHGRGEFTSESRDASGQHVVTRYSFSDIRPDALRWDSARSGDGGATWKTNWIMEFTRRDPAALPLLHGPWIADDRERQCRQPQAAELDFLAGGWVGVEHRLEEDGRWSEHPARATIVPILEGCALMDFIEIGGDDGYERFAIRAWEARPGHWTQYEMDTVDGVFVRTTGQVTDATIRFTESGGAARRVVWSRDGSGRVIRTDDVSRDGGATWTTTRRLELSPTFYGDRGTAH